MSTQSPERKEPKFTFILELSGVFTLFLSFVWGFSWMLHAEKMDPEQLWEKAMGAAVSFIVGVGFCAASAVKACKSKWQLFLVVIALGCVLLFFAGYSYLIGWQ
jgi:cation transport ATPase